MLILINSFLSFLFFNYLFNFWEIISSYLWNSSAVNRQRSWKNVSKRQKIFHLFLVRKVDHIIEFNSNYQGIWNFNSENLPKNISSFQNSLNLASYFDNSNKKFNKDCFIYFLITQSSEKKFHNHLRFILKF